MLLVEERLRSRLLQPARRGHEVEQEPGRESGDVANRNDAARRATDHERLQDDDAELALRGPTQTGGVTSSSLDPVSPREEVIVN